MRIVGKFALIFVAASYLVLAALGYLHARSEAQAFRRLALDDLHALGAAMAAATSATWDSAGPDAALEVAGRLVEAQPDASMRWSAGPGEGLDARVASSEGEHVEASFEVRSRGSVVGRLHIARGVPSESDILRRQLVTELIGALFITLVGGGLALLVGVSIIGRPLERIVAQARRIGAGDFSTRLKSSGTDEMGELKRALNRMCDELAASSRALAAETAAKTQTLEQLRHLDRLRTVGTLASALAHELGTPMNVVLLRAQQLASLDTSDESIREAGEAMARHVERMIRIVRQLLDFARQERPRLVEVLAATVARDAASLVRPLAERAEVELVVEQASDVVVLGDAGQIEQALTNLIVNAIHATPARGRVVVRVVRHARACPPSTVGIPARRAAAFVVEDTGCGLSAEELEKVFAPFYSGKPVGTGTGLGLTVAQGIAEDHSGWLTAESVPGKTAFTLWIPEAGGDETSDQGGDGRAAIASLTAATSS